MGIVLLTTASKGCSTSNSSAFIFCYSCRQLSVFPLLVLEFLQVCLPQRFTGSACLFFCSIVSSSATVFSLFFRSCVGESQSMKILKMVLLMPNLKLKAL